MNLKEKISAALLVGIEELHRLQKDVDNKYRITPIEFWRTTQDVILINAQLVKAFIDGIPEKQFVDVAGVKEVMNELDEALLHTEKQILINSVEQINN